MPTPVNARFLFASALALSFLAVTETRGQEKEAKPAPESAKTAPAAKAEGPTFAFLCLADTKLPETDDLRANLVKWLKLKTPDALKNLEAATKDGKTTYTFTTDGKMFSIAMADFPIPKEDIEYACDNSLGWPEAAKEMERQKAHLIVMALGNFESPIERALALSRVVAAASESFSSVGVYWGHASIVHSPAEFRDEIKEADLEMEKLPIPMWVGFLIGKGKTDGMDLYTRGLDVFGAMEVEILDSKRKPSDMFSLVNGLAAYLIVKGNVIKDGDTVGGTDEEKVPSSYADSAIGRPGKVIRLDY